MHRYNPIQPSILELLILLNTSPNSPPLFLCPYFVTFPCPGKICDGLSIQWKAFQMKVEGAPREYNNCISARSTFVSQ